jgi:hypothetical protein
VRRIHPLRAEHKCHASAVYHHLVFSLLLDAEEKLPMATVGADSEMPFAERHKVGKKNIGVWAYIVRLEAVNVEDR